MALKYSIKFVLLNTKVKNKPTSLRCFVRYKKQQVPFTTGINIEPRYFNSLKQRAEETTKFDGRKINQQLEQIKDFVSSRFEELVDYPDPNALKKICDRFIRTRETLSYYDSESLDEKSGVLPTGIISCLELIYKESELGVRLVSSGPRKGQKYQERSLKGYRTTINILKKFADYEMVTDFPFRSVNDDFYKRFSSFFYNNLKLTVGYFASNIKYIKLAMNEAKSMGLHSGDTHNSRIFIKPIYETDSIYLSMDQIKKLQQHEFSTNENVYDNARDLFIVGCWTGLRFSDFSTLTPKDIKDNVIRIKMQKTSGRVAIPMHPMLQKVVDKYNGAFPRAISNQKLNDYIKVAARKAGLDEKVIVRKNVAGIDVEETKELCDLITTHTARRSFATNMFKKGIPTLLIMAITGHKTEAAFLKYIRVSNEEKAQMMAELWKKIDWD